MHLLALAMLLSMAILKLITTPLMFTITTIILIIFLFLFCNKKIRTRSRVFRKPQSQKTLGDHSAHKKRTHYRSIGFRRKKTEWVKDEIIRLKALLPNHGCRSIAATFNRIHAHKNHRIGKTYASDIVKHHRYEILLKRKDIKNKPPYPVRKNRIWGMDLTFTQDEESKRSSNNKINTIFGICKRHSRLAISLTAIKDKASITILRAILDAIEQHEKLKIIRTDNEAVFTSKLFKCVLWFLRIKHQTTQLHSPWQNGRIERLFGTFKTQLKTITIVNPKDLQHKLNEFQFWYNNVRPHQNLKGKTPAEVWRGIDVYRNPKRRWQFIHFWNGELAGFYPSE